MCRLFLCIAVLPWVGCCVALSTSWIAAPILDRPGAPFPFLAKNEEKKADFFFSSSFPSADPNKKIVCIAAPQWVDWCVAVKPNTTVAAPKDEEDNSDFSFFFLLLLLTHTPARRVYCLRRLHELIVVLRHQTGPFSTYSFIYRRPWPIVINGDECCRCKTSPPPPPGVRGRQHGDRLHS